ncbi:hypothetical protein VT84_09830 [Gemmata sp. SH-PL17]|nr:hypothetical protein VT84_09830 [Gemmata sp. SH-PL17]
MSFSNAPCVMGTHSVGHSPTYRSRDDLWLRAS